LNSKSSLYNFAINRDAYFLNKLSTFKVSILKIAIAHSLIEYLAGDH
jgi:hypothetical protein